jgi:hypothetical protein
VYLVGFIIRINRKPVLQSFSRFFLLQLNAHKLNTYLYHQLPLTCLDVCYTIFRETTELLAQTYMLFEQVTQ